MKLILIFFIYSQLFGNNFKDKLLVSLKNCEQSPTEIIEPITLYPGEVKTYPTKLVKIEKINFKFYKKNKKLRKAKAKQKYNKYK